MNNKKNKKELLLAIRRLDTELCIDILNKYPDLITANLNDNKDNVLIIASLVREYQITKMKKTEDDLINMIYKFINMGANINHYNKSKKTMVYYLTQDMHFNKKLITKLVTDDIEIVWEYKKSKNQPAFQFISSMYGADKELYKLFNIVLDKIENVNICDWNNDTIFHYLIFYLARDIDFSFVEPILQKMISRGYNVNSRDKNKNNAIHLLIEYMVCNLNIYKFLLKHNFKLNLEDCNYLTPLELLKEEIGNNVETSHMKEVLVFLESYDTAINEKQKFNRRIKSNNHNNNNGNNSENVKKI